MKMRLKAEWEPQERVYLCFGSDKRPVYGKERLARIREDLGVLARAIRPFAPVTMLVNPGDETQAADICGYDIDLLVMRHFDIWARDTLGLPLRSDNGALSWLDMNFNVWGEVSRNTGYAADRELARLFAQTHLGCPVHKAGFTLEGGALETDGRGTLMTTESCVLHDKRNGALDRQSAEVILQRETGARSVIWLPGYKGKDDITRGHIDGLARFVGPGRVVVEAESADGPAILAENQAALASARSADGSELNVINLMPPPNSILVD
ncbi:MAG: agmatine deiminase family protein [Pseudomonadota bacterium]